MIKSKIQIVLLTLGLLSTALGVWTLLQIPTVILPAWNLVLILLPLTLLIALGLGFLVRKLFKLHWHTLTISSILMTIACLTFYFSTYRPGYTIYLPDQSVGEITLLVSRESNNDLNINPSGIGYITKETFENGFHPTVIKNKEDITREIKNYDRGAFSSVGSLNLSFDYVTFTLPGHEENSTANRFEELIKIHAIDTMRLLRK